MVLNTENNNSNKYIYKDKINKCNYDIFFKTYVCNYIKADY